MAIDGSYQPVGSLQNRARLRRVILRQGPQNRFGGSGAITSAVNFSVVGLRESSRATPVRYDDWRTRTKRFRHRKSKRLAGGAVQQAIRTRHDRSHLRSIVDMADYLNVGVT